MEPCVVVHIMRTCDPRFYPSPSSAKPRSVRSQTHLFGCGSPAFGSFRLKRRGAVTVGSYGAVRTSLCSQAQENEARMNAALLPGWSKFSIFHKTSHTAINMSENDPNSSYLTITSSRCSCGTCGTRGTRGTRGTLAKCCKSSVIAPVCVFGRCW